MTFSYDDIPEDDSKLRGFCRDLVDEIQRLTHELRRQENDTKFYASAIDHIPNAIFVKDEDGCILLLNKEYERIFGINRNSYIGKTTLDLGFISDEPRFQYQDEDTALIESGGVVHYDMDFTFADGNLHPCFYWSKGFEVEDSGDKGLVGEIVDISKERLLEQQLTDSLRALEKAKDEIELASKIDPGTGLFNRYVFDAQTRDIINDARKNNTNVCVMMADLDHFKRVNDTFGHLEGDRVLKEFADILRAGIRSADVPIRYGGEEFLVFLRDTDLTRAKLVAERLRETTSKSLKLPDDSYLTVSIGVVKFKNEETRTQCIERADEALYTAKETGRNKVVVFAEKDAQYMG